MQVIVWMQTNSQQPRAGVQMSRTAMIALRTFMVSLLGVTLSRVPPLAALGAKLASSPVIQKLTRLQPILGPVAKVLGLM